LVLAVAKTAMGRPASELVPSRRFQTTRAKCHWPWDTSVVSTSTSNEAEPPGGRMTMGGDTFTPRAGSSFWTVATQVPGSPLSPWIVRLNEHSWKQAASAIDGWSKVTPTRLAPFRSRRPAPTSKGSAGVTPSSLTSPDAWAVLVRAVLTSSGVQPGCLARSRAAEPATWGDAMEVPERKAKSPPCSGE
jgi:hypothetical protein